MAAATERIVVRVTSVQKRAIARTAKRLGLNVSELMCRAVQRITSLDDEENINGLIRHVNVSTQEENDALDDALSFVAESNKRIAAMAGGC
jgi:uncharacterized protein (DUF1778 family)